MASLIDYSQDFSTKKMMQDIEEKIKAYINKEDTPSEPKGMLERVPSPDKLDGDSIVVSSLENMLKQASENKSTRFRGMDFTAERPKSSPEEINAFLSNLEVNPMNFSGSIIKERDLVESDIMKDVRADAAEKLVEEEPVVEIAKAIEQDQGRQQDTSTLKGGEVGLMSRPSGSMGDGESIVTALDIAADIKNVDPNDILKKVIMPMAYHESDGTMDPTLAQYGGGTARGVMQYEPARFETSVKRAKNQFKALGQSVPQWIDNIDLSGDIPSEITSLTADQQMSLAVYDLLQKGGADIGKVLSGKQTVQDFWADHWWAGDKKQRKARIAAFNRSQRQLNKNTPSNTTTFEFP